MVYITSSFPMDITDRRRVRAACVSQWLQGKGQHGKGGPSAALGRAPHACTTGQTREVLSDPLQRLKEMIFIFCHWHSKASTGRSCCESSPASAQDVQLCARVHAGWWVLERWQRALQGGQRGGSGFPPYWELTSETRLVLWHDCAVKMHTHSWGLRERLCQGHILGLMCSPRLQKPRPWCTKARRPGRSHAGCLRLWASGRRSNHLGAFAEAATPDLWLRGSVGTRGRLAAEVGESCSVGEEQWGSIPTQPRGLHRQEHSELSGEPTPAFSQPDPFFRCSKGPLAAPQGKHLSPEVTWWHVPAGASPSAAGEKPDELPAAAGSLVSLRKMNFRGGTIHHALYLYLFWLGL